MGSSCTSSGPHSIGGTFICALLTFNLHSCSPAALPNLEKPWTHEQGSEMMLDHLVAHNNIGRPQSDYDFIKALIAGEHERVCVVACR